ncbi:thiolase family protein [Desulfovibrio sp. OttesenSCG-928-C14]|nr:thiolase family protein [Desulfovibrio sp. OttesenSCG-928-C14]
MKELRNKYAIVGLGYTEQGKVPGRTAASFHQEACANAIQDAGLAAKDIDGLFLYRHFSTLPGNNYLDAFRLAEALGIRPVALSQEYYCTRSWLAHAVGLLETGQCSYVLISYGDGGRSGKRDFTLELDQGLPTDELAAFGDLSLLAKYALVARRAMYEYGTGPEVWKEIAVAQRRWANLNPSASFYSKPLSPEAYLAEPYLVEPFRLLDATGVSDGGRALILTSADRAKALGRHPLVTIRGYGQANAPELAARISVGDPDSAGAVAGRKAFAMAGLAPKDMDAAQIYDCFTYTVEMTLADYGFFDPRASAEFLSAERLGPGGDFPLNTSGGLLSEAYFMGLTPVCEAVMQLMGRCGQRQLGRVPGSREPALIVCSDNGGALQSHETIILERS